MTCPEVTEQARTDRDESPAEAKAPVAKRAKPPNPREEGVGAAVAGDPARERVAPAAVDKDRAAVSDAAKIDNLKGGLNHARI